MLGSPWRVLPTANPVMPNGTLAADSCTSPMACTAVGAYEDKFGTELPLAERLNGTRWTAQRTPSPAGTQWTSLFGVSCASPRACIAVGYYVTSAGNLLGFAERWNGTRWVVQLTPDPPGSQGSGLFAISCPAARSCVATGLYASRAGIIAPLAELWNGVRWSALPGPVPAAGRGAEFVAVSCSAADACTAAGDYITSTGTDVTLAERLTAAGWTLQRTPNPANSFDSELSGISCTSAHACTAAGGYADAEGDAEPLAEAWNGTTWRLQATPFLPQPIGAHGGGVFSALSCATPKACVAAGTYLKLGKHEVNQASLVERWNGTRWRVQASPNPARSHGTALSGISCPAATTCTATGSYPVVEPVATIEGTVQPTQTLAEVWHGTRWRIQSTANRSGATIDDDLSAVSCTSPTTCTAVGSYADPARNLNYLAEAERWNGTTWTVEPSPRPAGSIDPGLEDVSCTSPRACTAVGSYANAAFDSFALAERWNGAHWVIQPSSRFAGGKNAQLFAVSCTTAQACTAVGANGKNVPLAERWDGARWSAQRSPRPAGTGGSELIGVSCASAHACIAVGEFVVGDKREQTLAERWNGTGWTIKPTPNPARARFAELDDVSCSSANRCTAIGVSELSNGSQRTLAERWNGARWTIQPTPNRAAGASLNGVSCPSAQACTAVGLYHLANGATWMLVESWNGSRWSIEPTPALNAYDSGLASVSCTTPRACTAAGFYFGLTGFSLNLAITR